MKKNFKKISDPFEILDEITKIGKVEKSVDLTDNISVILCTIDAEEEAEIFDFCSEFEGVTYIMKNKVETLAHAIKGLNKKRFDYNKIEDAKERKEERLKVVDGLRERINGWRDEIITYLYEQFFGVMGDSEARLRKLGIMAKIETEKALDKIKTELDEVKKTDEIETDVIEKTEKKEEKEQVKE